MLGLIDGSYHNEITSNVIASRASSGKKGVILDQSESGKTKTRWYHWIRNSIYSVSDGTLNGILLPLQLLFAFDFSTKSGPILFFTFINCILRRPNCKLWAYLFIE